MLQTLGGAVLVGGALAGAGLPSILVGYLLVVAPLGLVLPNSTALALADHGGHAGSASAILGAIAYLTGAAIAPLVSVGGTTTALPSALVIAGAATAGLLVLLALTARHQVAATSV